jgi:hypothetical protein
MQDKNFKKNPETRGPKPKVSARSKSSKEAG